MNNSVQTYRVIYTGRVQGVGFRHTVWTLSHGFPVTGYVKNLSDGTVEMLAECSRATFQNFDGQIRQRFQGNITTVDVIELDDPLGFDAFKIRR